jgi:hypothetical protein
MAPRVLLAPRMPQRLVVHTKPSEGAFPVVHGPFVPYARGFFTGNSRVLEEIRVLKGDVTKVVTKLGSMKGELCSMKNELGSMQNELGSMKNDIVALKERSNILILIAGSMIYAVAARSARLRHQNQKPSNVQ